jgi:hypothetical protein
VTTTVSVVTAVNENVSSVTDTVAINAITSSVRRGSKIARMNIKGGW